MNKQTAVVDKDRARSGRKTRHPGGSREGDKKKLKAKTPSRSPTKKEPRRKEPLWFGKKEVQVTPAVKEVGDKLISELIGRPQGKEEVEVALPAGKISQESPNEI